MRAITLTQAGTGTSGTAAMDVYVSPFNASLSLVSGAGGGNFTVQHTFDDYFNPPPGGMTWFNHAFMAGVAANSDGNYAFPVSAIRLVCGTVGAAATGTLIIRQAGVGGL